MNIMKILDRLNVRIGEHCSNCDGPCEVCNFDKRVNRLIQALNNTLEEEQ